VDSDPDGDRAERDPAVAAPLKALALVCLTSTAWADARIAHGNDAFSELVPPLDDTGFTTDLAFALWRPWGAYDFGGSYLHRWVTEKSGADREDLVELAATASRRWGERHRELIAGARTGPVLTGNWGGRWMQNAWHSVSRTGPTLDEGLADHYPEARAFGWLAGARIAGAWGVPAVQAYGVADAQVSVGTGVTSLELAAGVRAFQRVRCVELGAHLEGAIDRFAVLDDALTLRGGYGTGRWERAWRAGVHVAWNRTMISYEYRANEGGSGEPIGVVAVTIKQSGHTF
jgi:hypothetical protein